MQIGDHVVYQGCLYVLRGLDPMSVPDRGVELEHEATGERLLVPFDEVSEPEPRPA